MTRSVGPAGVGTTALLHSNGLRSGGTPVMGPLQHWILNTLARVLILGAGGAFFGAFYSIGGWLRRWFIAIWIGHATVYPAFNYAMVGWVSSVGVVVALVWSASHVVRDVSLSKRTRRSLRDIVTMPDVERTQLIEQLKQG